MNKNVLGCLCVITMVMLVVPSVMSEEVQKAVKRNEIGAVDAKQRAECLREIDKLISATKKISSDLRSHVKSEKKLKKGGSSKRERKAARDLAGKLDETVKQLSLKRESIKNGKRDFESDLKGVLDTIKATERITGFSDLGQKLQFQLQEANNTYSRASKAISNMMSKDSETKDSIVENLK